MSWRAYKVVFRLRSPLHSGWRKVGNLQMTRPFVTGRMLWGALTMRLTRDSAGNNPATDSNGYKKVGKQVNQELAYTYFYPALKDGNKYNVHWPWVDDSKFRHLFMGCYASTALSYPQQAAAEGSLHEVEFLSPRTIDGRPVFLLGYIFEKSTCTLKWREALHRLQLGGERGYGWGLVEPVACEMITDSHLFDETIEWSSTSSNVKLKVAENGHVAAHVEANHDLNIEGEIEPLVGREWRSTNTTNNYAGQHVSFSNVCFIPGGRLMDTCSFIIGDKGIWRAVAGDDELCPTAAPRQSGKIWA